MTKPKLLPSLCKQMSIVFEITPEVLSGAFIKEPATGKTEDQEKTEEREKIEKDFNISRRF